MEIRHLKTFLGVAKVLSFNKAAEHLNYAQSSVSAQIQALEEELGVQLFDRLGRRILLTEAGLKLLNYAEKMVQLVDETRAELTSEKEPQGSLCRVCLEWSLNLAHSIICQFVHHLKILPVAHQLSANQFFPEPSPDNHS